jgi:hypothetical protein
MARHRRQVDGDRRSSLTTFFELRASRWFVRLLVGAVLAASGYGVTHWLVK